VFLCLCVFVFLCFLCFCVLVFLALCIDLLTDQVQPLSRSTETASLRKDLKSMTMENQVISSAANRQNVEHRGLVGRVEELTTRLQHSLNDVDTAKRDREDLMTTYRMVIQERASLEHTVAQLTAQRESLMGEASTMKDENIFLRKQLTISINELKKYSIDLNEKEQTTSDVQEENHYLTRKLEELQHTTGSHRNTVQLAQNATAAMAADAETLR
jgi:chromosome segregation ATPase